MSFIKSFSLHNQLLHADTVLAHFAPSSNTAFVLVILGSRICKKFQIFFSSKTYPYNLSPINAFLCIAIAVIKAIPYDLPQL